MAFTLPPLRPATDPARVGDLWSTILAVVAPNGPPSPGLEAESAYADGRSARKLAEKLGGDADFNALTAFLEHHDPDQTWLTAAARAKDVGVADDRSATAVLALAGEWKGSGARQRQLGVALHLTTARLFGVSDAGFTSAIDAGMLAAANRLLAQHGSALESFVRLQHEWTQAFVREPVVALRGAIVPEPPDCTGVCQLNPQLWPLSSFSLDGHAAEEFPMHAPPPKAHERYVVLMAEVPHERMLATSVSGFASLFEYEAVVIGGDERDRVWCFVGSGDQRVGLGSTDAYWAAALAAA